MLDGTRLGIPGPDAMADDRASPDRMNDLRRSAGVIE
jgi:hypothetical protein